MKVGRSTVRLALRPYRMPRTEVAVQEHGAAENRADAEWEGRQRQGPTRLALRFIDAEEGGGEGDNDDGKGSAGEDEGGGDEGKGGEGGGSEGEGGGEGASKGASEGESDRGEDEDEGKCGGERNQGYVGIQALHGREHDRLEQGDSRTPLPDYCQHSVMVQ